MGETGEKRANKLWPGCAIAKQAGHDNAVNACVQGLPRPDEVPICSGVATEVPRENKRECVCVCPDVHADEMQT